jgi:hypothetical protein
MERLNCQILMLSACVPEMRPSTANRKEFDIMVNMLHIINMCISESKYII